jgi:hypothetical protein
VEGVVLAAVDALDVLAAVPGRPSLRGVVLILERANLAADQLALDRLAVDVHHVAADLDRLARGGDHATDVVAIGLAGLNEHDQIAARDRAHVASSIVGDAAGRRRCHRWFALRELETVKLGRTAAFAQLRPSSKRQPRSRWGRGENDNAPRCVTFPAA